MGRTKFIVGGVLILAAVVYLIFSATKANAEYFMTVDELKAKSASMVSQDVRISGAVVGDTIQYDANTLTLTFDVAQVPGDQKEVDAQGGLAAVLHARPSARVQSMNTATIGFPSTGGLFRLVSGSTDRRRWVIGFAFGHSFSAIGGVM